MEAIRTTIIATIGPASKDVVTIARMIHAGMSVVRLNFSHGTHGEHAEYIRSVRKAEKKTGKTVAILQDLQGPKLRLGILPKAGIELKKGEEWRLSGASLEYEGGNTLPIDVPELYRDVKKDHRVFLDDGVIEAKVLRVEKKEIVIRIINGGRVSSNKGMNVPDSVVSLPAFTEEDQKDLLFGLEQGVDIVALSFVTDPITVTRVRALIAKKCKTLGRTVPQILVKIERRQAIERLEEILTVSDAVMVARGDLGIEMPFEELPILQKEIIDEARRFGVPVIVATQMLHSMTLNPRATRAEITDTANAVFDHADGVMLSSESAVGEYPVESVATLRVIIAEAEKNPQLYRPLEHHFHVGLSVQAVLASTLAQLAELEAIDLVAIVGEDEQAMAVLRYARLRLPVYVATRSTMPKTRWHLFSHVFPVAVDVEQETFVYQMDAALRKQKLLRGTQKCAYLTTGARGQLELIVR